MKRLLKKIRIQNIDVFIYKMDVYSSFDILNFKHTIQKEKSKNRKIRYYILDSNIFVHESYLYSKVFLLQAIKKVGPVIGDCLTNNDYRGQSIYPYVINRIAKEALEQGTKEVFVIVNQNNVSSIKGIEKAGFKKAASLKAQRWLWFYLSKNLIYFN